ncbi:hypothetical protein QR685DRAFT_430650 [Neurospora intermedia]|uniref:Uncharacterized protein n=1 Tax=Neurospora intermedia TaxID=5142 RepID=A0ABR3DQ48_NEUIN
MSDFQRKNKQSRVPYEVRTSRFSNFPTPEPFHHDAKGLGGTVRLINGSMFHRDITLSLVGYVS